MFTKKKIAFFFALLFFMKLSVGQVNGRVTDQAGEPLPFVSIYVEGTTLGTVSNLDGYYELPLEDGRYQLIFQFIGYKRLFADVVVAGAPVKLSVSLEAESISLKTIEVRVNEEDPAYAIIRKAIAKRNYYKELVPEFACDVYIKGNVKVLEAPDKIMGQEVGDMDGNLDTLGQGIVYLSESVSKLYCRQPDRFKEIMVSSKVSGSDNGFSFNSAQDMNLDLYRNFAEYSGRSIISPIADGALNHYRYRLEGVTVDEDGRLVNKIKIIPKRREAPVYQGFIYIVDGLWNLQSTDVFLEGGTVQNPLFDTLRIRQTYVPVAKPDTWRLFSQTFSIMGGAFGFRFGGSFTGIYTGYDLQPGLGENFFGNEVMKVEKGSNERDSAYWETLRPVPLTAEETEDYHRKDSIRVVRESKPYLDSIDQVKNKFEFGDLLFGYTWRNSWKRRSYDYETPLATFQFNAVQGFTVDLDFSFSQAFDKNESKRLKAGTKLNYGFAEGKFRPSASFEYGYDPKNFGRVKLNGGRELAQFNEVGPISTMLNAGYSLFAHRHEIRLYDKRFLRGELGREVVNGVLAIGHLQFAHRATVENQTSYSFFKKERVYEENIPENDQLETEAFLENSRALTLGLSVRLRPGQKYFNYPDQKFVVGSKFPDIWLHWRGGIPFGQGSSNCLRSEVNFHRVSAALQKRDIKFGLVGKMAFRAEAGTFLGNKQVFFQDFKHFLGNEINVANQTWYLYSFKNLPYYGYSTRKYWVEAHWEHNFQGFILDRVPLVKKLGWKLVAGANFLYTPEEKDYFEASLGVDNVGFGIVRLFRFDVTRSFKQGKDAGMGYLIGVNLPLEEFDF